MYEILLYPILLNTLYFNVNCVTAGLTSYIPGPIATFGGSNRNRSSRKTSCTRPRERPIDERTYKSDEKAVRQ